MIVSENLTTYLHSLGTDGSLWLEELRSTAIKEGVPIIRREMESFLKVLLKMKAPSRILEIGTGIGYSALFMELCVPGASICTIENYEPRLIKARENLASHPNITLLEGDAAKILSQMDSLFDFIFLDAAKGQYHAMLPDVLRLMAPGGILLADNVLQEGKLIQSRYLTPRRQRTIHERMREFIWEVMHNQYLDACVIPIGDGVVLAKKKEEEAK